MFKIRLIRILCLVAAFASVFCLFDGFTSTPVVADTVNDIETLEVETDPMHYRFVGRLYSIILRQDTCDKEEKEKLAGKLKGGITEAYNVLFHFYFSPEYRALGHSDEQFVEDLYTGCYGRYADDKGKAKYVAKLEKGYSRYLVFKEFISSNEFVKLCYAYNIRVKKILIENYIDHLDGMTCIGDDYYDLDKKGNLGRCYKNAAKHVRCINEQLFRSKTKYYIIADIDNCYIEIFKGSVGKWSLYKIYPMSCGKKGHSTPRGTYKVTKKLSYFYSHGSLCYHATQWNGPYYFHSVTYNYNGTVQDGRLGQHVSAGCIRLRKDVAKWIYDNIPKGTTVKTV